MHERLARLALWRRRAQPRLRHRIPQRARRPFVEEEPAESRLTESVKDVPVDLVSGEIVILTNAEKWWNYFFKVN